MRARFVVVIVSLALVYAFTCSVTCANCLGAGADAVAESQGCGHAADTGGGAHQHTPTKPDCFGHHHCGFELVQSDGLSLVQLSARDYASQLIVSVFTREVVNVASSFLSELAPAQDSTISPHRKISILRI
jgi:hypothetical protein